MTDRSVAAKKRRQADQDRNDVALLPPLKRQSEDSHCETRSKRARVPPSHGRAFSSDEDGDGPHSDPAVLAAIAAIEDPDVRQYAEQRCTEASLQQLLRENPAHAYFCDRLKTLYDRSIDARVATDIEIMEMDIHAVMHANDLQDNVIAQLLARVGALEQQLQQQPVVNAEAVV